MNLYPTHAIRQDFSKAAVDYDRHADLQRDILSHVIRLIYELLPASPLVLDAGCGTGQLVRQVTSRWRVMQVDIAHGMCLQAWQHHPNTIAADIAQLPFAADSFDGTVCASVLQWVQPRRQAFSEIYRCLKPGGVSVCAVFGEQTLSELKMAFTVLDNFSHVSSFPTQQELLEQAQSAGFSVLASHSEICKEYYGSVRELMQSLKALGARNKRSDRRKTLTPLGQLLRVEEAYKRKFATGNIIPATWQVHYLVLKKS